MGSCVARRWPSLLTLALLLSALVPSVALAQPEPEAPVPTADALCTGGLTDPVSNYNGTCGPSLTVPAWSDASGWWNEQSTRDTIQLFDLDGDGSDELIGLGQHGLQVYSWHSAWGQWVPASDPKRAGPFADIDVYYDSIRFGELAEGVRSVIGVHFNPDGGDGVAVGLQTWSWNPGNGSPGAGSWTFQGEDTAFAKDATAPSSSTGFNFGMSHPSWRVPTQFVAGGLPGAGYGILIRVFTGMQFCSFDMSGQTWSCKQVTSAFQDDFNNDGDGNQPDYFYGTIQLADVYTGAEGLELIGRDGTNGGSMQVYTWDSSSQTFNHLALTGQTPFDSSWNATQYTATIRAVRYVANDPAYELVGHGPAQLVYWGIWASGCGGHTAPCWKKYGGPNIQSTPFTSPAYSDPQFYETFIVTDLDGDGLDETMARDPHVGFTTWGLHKSWGWYNLDEGPVITSFPGYALWATPAYYETIKVADVGDGQKALIGRGKYGIRTWTWQGKDGWQRPLPYGFHNFATSAEDNAFAMLNGFLNIADGNTIRDSYTSVNSDVMGNYEDCLNNSIEVGNAMPPERTCELTGLQSTLSNPHNVTAADWQNMVNTILTEVALARDVDGHFNDSLSKILNDLYNIEPNEFDTLVQTLFPSNTPSSDTGIEAALTGLFFGAVEGLAGFAGPEASFAAEALAGSLGAVTSLQTASSSQINTELSGLRQHIVDTNTAAIQRNSDMFQYVAQDSGLLNLYGNLISDQMWEIQAAQQNAAISSGEYTTAEWLYTAILPSVWNVALCRGTGGDDETCEVDQVDTGSTNSRAVYDDNQDFYAYLNNPNANDESGNYLGFQLSDTDPTFLLVFGDNPPDCAIAGTDASSNWTYTGADNRNCTLAKDIQAILAFEDPLSADFQCWVSYAPNQNPYQCGQGPPTGYGPPS